jgi:putative holliday junction resolvase
MATPDSLQTFLCFDYGRKRMGVAVGQRVTRSATPLKSIPARDGAPDWSTIKLLIEEWKADAIVVGIPYHMDGSMQETTEAAERFCRRLEGRYGLPVYRAEERLTSYIVESVDAGRHISRGDTDALAAQVILQDWLQKQESET